MQVSGVFMLPVTFQLLNSMVPGQQPIFTEHQPLFSTITFNFLMSLAGGMMAGYFLSKGDAFWTFSGGLGGIIAASAGNDLYHPLHAFIIAIAGVWVAYRLHFWVERKFKIDDAVGAVAVHGYAGSFGVIACGFVLWGYPAVADGSATITPWGQIGGAIVMFFVLGFIPAWIVAKNFEWDGNPAYS